MVVRQQTIAGRYELKHVVGTGGMSSVYCAFDTLLERNVALKILHDQYGDDEEYVERFRREARSVAQLSHPNIVTVIDRGDEDGKQFIVFELIEGDNLKELVERGGPLPVRRALELGLEVGRALAFAHGQGLDPPRREAAERAAERRRPRQGDRLRDRPLARRRRPDGDGHRARHEPLHRARAGSRRAGRRPDGHLLVRRRPLRAAHRRAAVPGRQLPHRCDEARQRSQPERARPQAGHSVAPRVADRALHGEAAGRPAGLDGRGRRRARGLSCGARREGRRRGDDDHEAAEAGEAVATAQAAAAALAALPAPGCSRRRAVARGCGRRDLSRSP